MPGGEQVRLALVPLAMRDQGWSGAAMLPYTELEYGGFRDTVEGLLKRFTYESKTPHVEHK